MSDPSLGQESPDPNEPPNVRQMREHIKKLETEAKEGAEAKAEAATLRRQLVLRDAGLELTDVQVKALSAVHEGDWSVDTVKATATQLGFGAPPPPPPSPVPAAELAATQRMNANAALGSSAAPAPNSPEEREQRIRQFRGSEAEFDAFLREIGTPMGTIGGPTTSGDIQQL